MYMVYGKSGVTNGCQEDMCNDEIGVYVLKIYRHHSRFNDEHTREGICDHSKSKRIFT